MTFAIDGVQVGDARIWYYISENWSNEKRREMRNSILFQITLASGPTLSRCPPGRGTHRPTANLPPIAWKCKNIIFLLFCSPFEYIWICEFFGSIEPTTHGANAFFRSQLSTCQFDINNDFFLAWIKRFAFQCIAWNVQCHMLAHANSHLTVDSTVPVCVALSTIVFRRLILLTFAVCSC